MRTVSRTVILVAILALFLVNLSPAPAAAQTEWSVPVTAATGSEGSNPNLAFGTRGNATDSFDSGIDIPHPPIPTTFDAYFLIEHALFPQLDKDYRAPAETIEWTLRVESANGNITLTWDSSAVPPEVSLWLSEPDRSLKVNMKTGNNTALLAGVHTLTISIEEPAPCGAINLKQGWNLISLPLIPTSTAIGTVLADVDEYTNIVWAYNAATSTWTWWIPGDPDSTLSTMADGKGYWINMSTTDTLTVSGVVIRPPPALPPTYQVVEGWNLIGFKSCDPKPVSEYLAGLQGNYGAVYGFNNNAYFTVSGSDELQPGLGYWLAATEAGTIYP